MNPKSEKRSPLGELASNILIQIYKEKRRTKDCRLIASALVIENRKIEKKNKELRKRLLKTQYRLREANNIIKNLKITISETTIETIR